MEKCNEKHNGNERTAYHSTCHLQTYKQVVLLSNGTRQISAAIARRAYELFEARGSEHGHDCEDWFRAESELLTPIPATVVDTDGGFTVRAELPGFTGKDVEVLAEPRRLIIRARKQETVGTREGRTVLQGKMSD